MRVYTTLVPALNAPPHGSPGQRPGYRNRSVRPARAQESSAFQGGGGTSDTFRGRCPGLACFALLARQRGWVLNREKLLRTDLGDRPGRSEIDTKGRLA